MVSPRTQFRLEQFPGSLSPRWNKEETEIAKEREKQKDRRLKLGNCSPTGQEKNIESIQLSLGKWKTADVLLFLLQLRNLSKLVCN